MGKITIEKLKQEVNEGEFDCGNSSINSQIVQSYFPTLLQHCSTFECKIGKTTVGYFMFYFVTINFDNCPEVIAQYYTTLITQICSLHIGYIAVTTEFQKKKIGTYILKYIIYKVMQYCKEMPISVITVDALKERFEWYRQNGFQAFDETKMQDCNPTILMYRSCIVDSNLVNNYVIDRTEV